MPCVGGLEKSVQYPVNWPKSSPATRPVMMQLKILPPLVMRYWSVARDATTPLNAEDRTMMSVSKPMRRTMATAERQMTRNSERKMSLWTMWSRSVSVYVAPASRSGARTAKMPQVAAMMPQLAT